MIGPLSFWLCGWRCLFAVRLASRRLPAGRTAGPSDPLERAVVGVALLVVLVLGEVELLAPGAPTVEPGGVGLGACPAVLPNQRCVGLGGRFGIDGRRRLLSSWL